MEKIKYFITRDGDEIILTSIPSGIELRIDRDVKVVNLPPEVNKIIEIGKLIFPKK